MKTFNLPALGEEQYVLTLNKRELVIIAHLLGSVSGDHIDTWRRDTDELYDQLLRELVDSQELREMLHNLYNVSENVICATGKF